MATHNDVFLVGYLLDDPAIADEGIEGAEKVFIRLQTVRRDADDVDDARYEELFVFYDGTERIEEIKKLRKYDLIELKGVLNILAVDKPSNCPHCGRQNFRENGTISFVYPIWFRRVDNVLNSAEHSITLPDGILFQHYREVSNMITIVGTVVSEPEMIGTEGDPVCRYRVGVDRKYFIPTQPDDRSDYPWIYSRGKQAQDDHRHLQLNAVVLLHGYIHTKNVRVKTKCAYCGMTYEYPDTATDLIPYSLEYLSGHKTNADIAREEDLERRLSLLPDHS